MGKATKESGLGTEGRASWNKHGNSLFLFPHCFILCLRPLCCDWDHLTFARVQCLFIYAITFKPQNNPKRQISPSASHFMDTQSETQRG